MSHRRDEATFTAKVDVVEWLGNEAYAYIPLEASLEVRDQFAQLEKDLDGETLRTQLVISPDGASRISEDDEATIWVAPARSISSTPPPARTSRWTRPTPASCPAAT